MQMISAVGRAMIRPGSMAGFAPTNDAVAKNFRPSRIKNL
jgi:hypothetical protein